ncbi:uncharacterized protein LOC143204064 [Rhynchophorus ferrugineus]|uniref:uncharacterized protein LOC143204064 n=1 Tax=Rhynchophorus ferrugineus TaxID=354439 RepID=UPI003FCD7D47
MNTAEKLKQLLKKPPSPFNSIIKNSDDKDNFEGTNIERPASLTLKDMEPQIIAHRVIYSINKTILMLNIVAFFPFLLSKNGELLRRFLMEEENIFTAAILNIYNSDCHYDTVQIKNFIYESINNRNKGKYTEQDTHCDANLLQIIYLIHNNKCLRQSISTAEKPRTIPVVTELIRTIEELKLVTEANLYITGSEEKIREKRLREAFKTRTMLTALIKDLQQQLELQRNELENELNAKVNIVTNYNDKIAKHREEYQIRMEKIIHDSENKMMHHCLESEARQAILAEEAERAPKEYEALLDEHLRTEANLRARRLKTEIQLKNWVVKYDKEIGEKQTEYDDLKKEYDTEKEAVDTLQEQLDEQEPQYIELMEEKEEIEERIHMEMAYKFLSNRSARIIQRAWRAYRERRGKRKGKKGTESIINKVEDHQERRS